LAAPSGNILNIRSCDIDPTEHLILYELAWAFEFFAGCFSLVGNNYKCNSFFRNMAFVRSGKDSRPLDKTFFGNSFYKQNKCVIRQLTYDDCFDNGKFKSRQQFTGSHGIVFPPVVWMNLQSAILYAKKILLQKDENHLCKGVTIDKFVTKFKKGSKHFRMTIDKASSRGESCTDLSIVHTYAKITLNNIPEEKNVKIILGSWNLSYLTNNLREFIYKCRQNTLRTGDRLAHIISVDGLCFFCKNLPTPLLNKETFHHLFLNCPVTNSVLASLLHNRNIIFNAENSKFCEIFWYGIINQSVCRPTLLFFDIFRYTIWTFRSRKKIPRYDALLDAMINILDTVFNLRPSVKRTFTNTLHFNTFLQAMG
jgi:hypothetical protein